MAEWFAPKRYGWGLRPIRWQGWLITLVYVMVVIAASRMLDRQRLAAASIIVTATILFLIIAINNTRGGLGWPWGKGDR